MNQAGHRRRHRRQRRLPRSGREAGTLGYEPEGYLGIPGREAFTTPDGAPAHHLYVCAAGNPELARHLAFRDILRAQSGTARTYAELKRSLAREFSDDQAGYSGAKTAFIEQILRQGH